MKTIANVIKDFNLEQGYSNEEWKAFASRIRALRGNFCECCKQGNRILHVHHLFYEPNRKLWEYEDEDMVVLCETCHREIHEQLKNFRRYVFRKLNASQFKILNGALAVAFDQYAPEVFTHALAEFVSTPSMVERYAKASLAFTLLKPWAVILEAESPTGNGCTSGGVSCAGKLTNATDYEIHTQTIWPLAHPPLAQKPARNSRFVRPAH